MENFLFPSSSEDDDRFNFLYFESSIQKQLRHIVEVFYTSFYMEVAKYISYHMLSIKQSRAFTFDL